jgi:succinate dehydrogenase flavin-adding protein (antitoxin of CptAB toxin-antitoxin module)
MSEEKSHYIASLCISSSILSAREITDILVVEPTRMHEKGTPMSSRNPNSRIREAASWIFDSTINPEELLSRHIDQIVSLIEDRVHEFEKLLEVCDMDIYCGFFSKGRSGEFILSPELLKRLTVIPIEIIVILYPPTNDSDDE